MKYRVVLLLVFFLLVACTYELGGIDLTSGNNGETIDTSPNQILNIKLDSNVTTGYKWNLVTEPNPAILRLVSSKYYEPTGGGPGAGGNETWQFQTVGTGTTTLKLSYFRPFDPNKVSAKDFSVTVRVQ